jgi:cobalt-precorrin 5A hydrolase
MKVSIIAFSTKGCEVALQVKKAFPDDDIEICTKTRMEDTLGLPKTELSLHEWTGKAFESSALIVFVGAIGIAVREIAPFVTRKDRDPAVVGIDELGHFVVPLLSGHIGGANRYALEIARTVGAQPVVTTATDINGKISIDAWAVRNGLAVYNLPGIKAVSSAVLEGKPVGLISDFPVEGKAPPELSGGEDAETGVLIGYDTESRPFRETLHLVPRSIVAGVGCRRGTSEEAIRKAVTDAFDKAGFPLLALRSVASIDLKKDEAGLVSFAASRRVPFVVYTSEELNAVPGEFTPSGFVSSVTGTDNVCERSAAKASGSGRMVLRKQAGNGVTVALAEAPVHISF